MRFPSSLICLVACLGSLTASPALAQTSVDLGLPRDNTLYGPLNGLSNGAGEHLFAGNTASNQPRRGLLLFDVAGSIPAGATILSAELRLHMSMSMAGNEPVSVHRALASWGEGASDAPGGEGGGAAAQPGDASWDVRFFPNSPWSQPGGDFAAQPSATTNVGGVSTYLWSGAALTADLQDFLDQPALNFGWFLIGNESALTTAKRFDSAQNSNPGFRPSLRVTYVANPCGTTVPAVETVRVGTPPNPAALLPGATSGPLIGATWDPSVDHTSFLPGAVIDLLFISPQPAQVPLSIGTVLIATGGPLITLTEPAGTPFAVGIPFNCAFLGVQRYAQVASGDGLGNIALTNALDLTIGNL